MLYNVFKASYPGLMCYFYVQEVSLCQKSIMITLGVDRRLFCSLIGRQVFPLFADWLLPGPGDGHRVFGGVPRRPARTALPGALHAAATAHHGVPQGTCTADFL